MTYAVKEVFYTLQGEGALAGRAAVFVRFAGCNLWTGRAADRGRGPGGCAAWCDTDFVGTDGPGGGRFADADALARACAAAWPHDPMHAEPMVVLTGGEPLLQVDGALVGALHYRGFFVALETNGTRAVPDGVDWVCVSPKTGAPLVATRGHELKLVYPQPGLDPEQFLDLDFVRFSLQPLDGPPGTDANTRAAAAYCLAHPRWRLSLQAHKVAGLP